MAKVSHNYLIYYLTLDRENSAEIHANASVTLSAPISAAGVEFIRKKVAEEVGYSEDSIVVINIMTLATEEVLEKRDIDWQLKNQI